MDGGGGLARGGGATGSGWTGEWAECALAHAHARFSPTANHTHFSPADAGAGNSPAALGLCLLMYPPLCTLSRKMTRVLHGHPLPSHAWRQPDPTQRAARLGNDIYPPIVPIGRRLRMTM